MTNMALFFDEIVFKISSSVDEICTAGKDVPENMQRRHD